MLVFSVSVPCRWLCAALFGFMRVRGGVFGAWRGGCFGAFGGLFLLKIKAAYAAIMTYYFVKLSKYVSAITNFKLSNSINFTDSFLVTVR